MTGENTMLDPFTYWSRVMSGWRMIGDTAARMERTATNSRAVISARSATMSEAARAPWTADIAELSLMVPEKLAAFSLAGSAVASAWWTMQADWAAEARHIARVMTGSRPPTLGEMADLSSRSLALGLRTFEASTRIGRDALAPIERTAAANARRLKKRDRD